MSGPLIGRAPVTRAPALDLAGGEDHPAATLAHGVDASARWGLRVLVAYLVVTLIPAVLAVRAGPTMPALAHLVGLAVAAAATRLLGGRSAGTVTAVLSWLPVLAVPLLYAELPVLMAGLGSSYRDATVQRWELALFGGSSPAQTLAPTLASVGGPAGALVVSEALHAGYLSFYAIIYLPLVILFARGERRSFGIVVAGLTTVFALTYLVFVLFPVQGPRYLWPTPPGLPDGPFRTLTLHVLEGGSSRGTAFPSAHVAIAVTQSLFALQWHRSFGVVLSALTGLLTLGAVYGGYHYAVDVIAGAGVGLVAGLMLRRASGSAGSRRTL